MTRISVAEAAARLEVNVARVHQRIADGSLAAEKVGHQWVIEAEDVLRLDRRGAGRPLSSRSAWALAWAASREGSGAEAAAADCRGAPRPLPAAERSRARARLRQLLKSAEARPNPTGDAQAEESPTAVDSAEEIAALARLLMKNRAQRRLFRCSPRDLADLRDDDRLKLAGISLPAAGIAAGEVVEAYVSVHELEPAR